MAFLKKVFLLIIVMIISIFEVKAIDPIEAVTKEPTKSDLIFNNEWDNFLAPFTYRSSLILLTGMTATYFVFEDDFEKKRNKKWQKKGEEKAWRKWGDIVGWGVLPAIYVSSMGIGYLSDDKPDDSYMSNSEYITKTVVYTGLTTFLFKLTIDQRRPKDRLKKDSFPSGHASSAFAFSTAVWLLHGPYWGLLTTGLASWIAYSRIDDGSHYYHDSIFGIALGMSYAYGIYNNHFKRGLPFKFAVLPSDNFDGLKTTVSYNF